MFVTQELLGGNDEVDLTKFTDELWKNIKDKYKAKLEVFIILTLSTFPFISSFR